jgi:hypothetical protein
VSTNPPAAIVDGAQLRVYLELGDATLVLGRDVLGDVMEGPYDHMRDVSCRLRACAWSWGASEDRGSLTEPATGQLELVIEDLEREFDPTNPASPWAEIIRRDRAVRVTVDDVPAWTGRVRVWAHSYASGESTATAYDALEEATRVLVSYTAAAGSAADQLRALAADAAYPLVIEAGPGSRARSSHRFGTNLHEAALDARLADLGHVWVSHSGRVHYADAASSGGSSAGYRATLGCDVPVTDLEGRFDRAGMVNAVRVDRFDPTGSGLTPYRHRDDASVLLYGIRELATSEQELDLEGGADAYTAWATQLVEELGTPADVIECKGIRPSGPQVVDVVCAEYRDTFLLSVPGMIERPLYVLGERVLVTPDAWTVELTAGPAPEPAPELPTGVVVAESSPAPEPAPAPPAARSSKSRR